MVNTDTFNYVDVLTRAADASALRNKTIANNIANIDTPHYKRQDVSFAANLQQALKNSRYKTLDQKIDSLNTKRLKGVVFTDLEAYSYRLDGNNVDVDTENVYMAENQLMYQGLTKSLSSEFEHFKAVLK
ncbi:MAG: flagellar basal body rod protein FlgB [Lachnospiraceae bacterium]|nr:flagellar basal body rod protein FlgB [Lachnospiraceae bacterium]MBQ5534019.1 flagellar basal body rod protein FlgB [Lachnospiraceae bacterium]MBQ9567506.1 flagellar basal body rod protein FlgB [Lachnospiraceae bacterium]MCR4785295.1 flagellar basal body rod protein FlgB [Lachnospiraceae bacterium]HBB58671.1 flagellar basal body rod protein FlgB [Lachnospiraceae bacterium]